MLHDPYTARVAWFHASGTVWNICSSVMLCSLEWLSATDVSEQPTGPILDFLTLEDETDSFSRNVNN
jgi:hypothetical protein